MLNWHTNDFAVIALSSPNPMQHCKTKAVQANTQLSLKCGGEHISKAVQNMMCSLELNCTVHCAAQGRALGEQIAKHSSESDPEHISGALCCISEYISTLHFIVVLRWGDTANIAQKTNHIQNTFMHCICILVLQM